MKVPSPKDGRPLFKNPASSDVALWAGVVLGGLATFGQLREYFDETKPGLSYFTAADFGALLIDAGLGFGISFLMFGVLPAAIRRRGRPGQIGKKSFLAIDFSQFGSSIYCRHLVQRIS